MIKFGTKHWMLMILLVLTMLCSVSGFASTINLTPQEFTLIPDGMNIRVNNDLSLKTEVSVIPYVRINKTVIPLSDVGFILPSILAVPSINNKEKFSKYEWSMIGLNKDLSNQIKELILDINGVNIIHSKSTYSRDEIMYDTGLILSFRDLLEAGYTVNITNTSHVIVANISDKYDTKTSSITFDPTAQGSCGTLSTEGEYVLNSSVNSTGTCFTISTSNVTLDCAGYTIGYDFGGTGGDGVVATTETNLTIKNCRIEDMNASGSAGYGIFFTTVVNSTILNNTIQTNGTSGNAGMQLEVNTNNNTISNNTIRVKGTSGNNYGIVVTSTGTGNVITGNVITTNGTGSNTGIRLEGTVKNHTVTDNNISTSGNSSSNTGISMLTTSHGHFVSRNIIQTSGENDNYGIALQSTSQNNTITNNNISTGGTSINNYGILFSTTAVSGNLIYNNTIQTGGLSNNYGIFISNSNNNTITNNNISTGGTTNNNHGIFLSGTVTGHLIKDNQIRTTGTDDNIGIRAQTAVYNNSIINNTINASGSTSDNYGIHLTGTVSENLIAENNIRTTGTGNNHGIRLESATNNTIANNTVTTNGTTGIVGIRVVTTADNNTIANNTVRTQGTSGSNPGFEVRSSSQNIIIRNNIYTNGTSDNYGIIFQISANNNSFINNTINATGTTSGNYGVWLTSNSQSNLIEANTIRTNGTSTSYGITIDTGATQNTIRKNTVITDGRTNNNPLSISAGNNTFLGNILTSTGPTLIGIEIIGANYSTFRDNTIANITNWIHPGTGINNFTNTTFETRDGKISILELFNLTNRQNVNQTGINITLNRVFLNSTQLTTLNISSQISLNNITFLSPRAQVDYEDDGTFSICNSPQCIRHTYLNNIFTFNVTRFTTYQLINNNVPTIILNTSIYPNGTNTHLNESVDVQINVTFLDNDGDNGTLNGTFIINNTILNFLSINPVVPNQTIQFNLSNTTFGRNATIYFNATGNDGVDSATMVSTTNVTVRNIPPPQITNLSITNNQRVRQNFTINWNQTGDLDDPLSNLGWNTTVNGTSYCGQKNTTTSCLVLNRPTGQNSFNITTLDGENYTSNSLVEVIVDETPPFYTNLSNVSAQQTQFTINWTINEPSNFSINYSENCAQLDNTISGNNFNLSGSTTLTNLLPGHFYCWRITFSDNVTSEFGANINISPIFNFTTLGTAQQGPAIGGGGGGGVSLITLPSQPNITQNITSLPIIPQPPISPPQIEDKTILSIIKSPLKNLKDISTILAILSVIGLTGLKAYFIYRKELGSEVIE